MILKGTSFAAGAIAKPVPVDRDGQKVFSLEPLGEFVLVPDQYRKACERLVGEITPTLQPVGIEGNFEGEDSVLNGLWVPPAILDYVKKQNGDARAA